MYEIYKRLRDAKGYTDYRVSKETGISRSTLAEWGSGKYTPKADKLQKIAILFGVPLDVFYVDEEETEQMPMDQARLIAHNVQNAMNYYLDSEVGKIAQEIMDSPGKRTLFKAVSKLDEESIKKYAAFIEGLTNDNNKSDELP